MVQVRPLFGLSLADSPFIDIADEQKAWDLHDRGLVAFKDEEEALMAALAEGKPYTAPPRPPAPAPTPQPEPAPSP